MENRLQDSCRASGSRAGVSDRACGTGQYQSLIAVSEGLKYWIRHELSANIGPVSIRSDSDCPFQRLFFVTLREGSRQAVSAFEETIVVKHSTGFELLKLS